MDFYKPHTVRIYTTFDKSTFEDYHYSDYYAAMKSLKDLTWHNENGEKQQNVEGEHDGELGWKIFETDTGQTVLSHDGSEVPEAPPFVGEAPN